MKTKHRNAERLLSIVSDSNSLQLSGYADNQSVIYGFMPGEDTLITTKQVLGSFLNNIKDWINMNHLKMNDFKTEFVVFGTRFLLDKSSVTFMCIGQSEIQESSCIRFLGTCLNDSTKYILSVLLLFFLLAAFTSHLIYTLSSH